MGCCKGKQLQLIRILVVLTSILTLIQGAGYLGLSIWSMLVHKCLQIPTKSSLEKVVYFIYFRDSECGEVNWSSSPDSNNNVIPIMPKVTTIANRTFYVFLIYAILSALWIITSLMVLGAFCSNVNRRAYRVCFLPWLIFILLGSGLDVIATVFFVNDIFYTETVEKALDYLSVKNTAEMITVLTKYEQYFIYPAIRMSLISSRCIFLWLFNIIAVSFSVKLTNLIIRMNEINNKTPQISVTQTFDGDTDADLRTNPNGRDNNNIKNKQRNERRSFEPLKNGEQNEIKEISPNQSLSPQSRSLRLNRISMSTEQQQQQQQQQQNQSLREQSLLSNRRVDNVRDYNDINDSPFNINPRHLHPHHLQYHDSQQSSPEPRDLYRNSVNNNNSNNNINNNNNSNLSNNNNNNNNHRDSLESEPELRKPEKRNINAELRSQLPWSYFGPRSDTTAPKHTLTHLSNTSIDKQHEVLPPIPVPDYTLHFPKDDRPSVKSYNQSSPREHSLSPSPRTSNPSRW